MVQKRTVKRLLQLHCCLMITSSCTQWCWCGTSDVLQGIGTLHIDGFYADCASRKATNMN